MDDGIVIITLTCKDCLWNDDGLCDRFGYFVDDDDVCIDKTQHKDGDS